MCAMESVLAVLNVIFQTFIVTFLSFGFLCIARNVFLEKPLFLENSVLGEMPFSFRKRQKFSH